MSEPRNRRCVTLSAFVFALSAIPVVGQMDWKLVSPTGRPTGRTRSAMAFDTARQRTVLFGGDSRSGLLSDTWEWDGSSWTQHQPATSPPGRAGHAMAYDAQRQRVVLFGGHGMAPKDNLGDTWEWDGSNWTRQQPATSPSARGVSAMAYDAARRRVVLFGGYNLYTGLVRDTWEWDGTTWKSVTPAAGIPLQRGFHAMVYDATRQRVVLFGGLSGFSNLNDTWEWDGTTWRNVTPVSGNPPPRAHHALVYDASRQRIVLFGGQRPWPTYALLNDTWEWDGRTWTQRTTTTSPTAVHPAAFAYDAARQRVVLFAGHGAVFLNDVWEWEGTTWTSVTPSTREPPTRHNYALAYDAGRRRVVLFGGQPLWPNATTDDTWEWGGKAWAPRKPKRRPPARQDHAMAYDAARQRVVLFGGLSPRSLLSDTWEWDGRIWTQLAPATRPPARSGHAMVYDSRRRRVVLFGGFQNTTSILNDTWEWDGNTWIQQRPTTSPQARYHHAMVYDAAAQRTVLFGGQGVGSPSLFLNDTWEWDGVNWQNVTPSSGNPPPRITRAMAYDAARQRIVLFGGRFTFQGRYGPMWSGFNDTWGWSGRTWTQQAPATVPPLRVLSHEPMVYDAARGSMFHFRSYDHEARAYAPRDLTASTHIVSVASGGRVKLSLDATPQQRGKAHIVLGCFDSPGPRGTRLGNNITLMLNPDPYFWLTLQNPNGLIANSLGTLDLAGRATATITVPRLPAAFIGLRFYHAYVLFGSSIDYASTPVPLTLAK